MNAYKILRQKLGQEINNNYNQPLIIILNLLQAEFSKDVFEQCSALF